jgi:hypothetical protein
LNYFRNTIFILAILVLILWLGFPFYLVAKDYQLKQPWKHSLETSRIYMVPIAIMFTLFKTLKRSDDEESEGWKVGITCFFAIVFMIGLTLVIISPCSSSVGKTLFTKRDNPKVRIVISHYGCGATITTPNTVSVVQIENISDKFERITDIDTTTLDPIAWIRHP